MGYDAFVSYSHAADGKLAPALQRGLERLTRPWYRARALAVFRDETGLAVSPHLWASIVRALDDSQWFVVLCSPEAARSEWVEREVAHWLTRKAPDRILLVLTDGDLVWDRNRGDFDPTASTALPPALLGRFGDEPRHLDLRWARGEEQLDVRHARFRSAVAELAAPIHNMEREELEVEDVRQHRRTMRLARGATTALVLLVVVSLTLGLVALQQRADARRESRAALRAANTARGRELAADALNASHIGRSDLALLLAVEASRGDQSPFVRSALFGSLLDQPALTRQLHGLDNSAELAAFSPDGQTLAASDTTGRIMLWDVGSGRALRRQPVGDRSKLVDSMAFTAGGGLLVAHRSIPGQGSGEFAIWDVRSGQLMRTVVVNDAESVFTASTNAALFATSRYPQGADVWDARTGALVRTLPIPAGALALDAGGSMLATATVEADANQRTFTEVAQVWNIATGEQLGHACRSSVGGKFVGDNVRMPPDSPYILNFALDPSASTVRTALSGGTNAVVSRCDVASGHAETTRVNINTPSQAPVVAVSPNMTTIATRDVTDGTIKTFDAASGAILNIVAAPTNSPSNFAPGSVVFAPDGHLMSAAQTVSAEVNLWTSRTVSPELAQQSRPVALADNGFVVGWDPSGATIAIRPRVDGPLVVIIDRRSGRRLAQGSTSLPNGVAFSADGQRVAIATTTSVTSTSVTIANLPSGSRETFDLVPLACHASIESLAFGPSVHTLTVSCGPDGTVAQVDISSARPKLLSVDHVNSSGATLSFSPNGDYLLATSGCHACSTFDLYDLSGGHLRSHQIGEVGTFGVSASVFSHDSRSFATSNGDGRIELWHPGNKTLQHTDLSLPGQSATVLSFSADDSLLAAGDCSTIRIWDIASTTLLGTIPQPATCTDAITFAGDGRSISSSGLVSTGTSPLNAANQLFGSVAIVSSQIRWDLDPTSWQHDACTIANRNLTRAEWAQYEPAVPYHETCAFTP
jgi:WD40 repeat protein